MRKITLLLCALLLGCIGMEAQPSQKIVSYEQINTVAQLKDGEYYILFNTGHGTFLHEQSNGNLYLNQPHDINGFVNSFTEMNYVIKLVQSNDKWKFQMVESGKFIPALLRGDAMSSSENGEEFTIENFTDGHFYINGSSNNLQFNGNGTSTKGAPGSFTGWDIEQSGGGNSDYQFYQVTLEDVEWVHFTYRYTLNNGLVVEENISGLVGNPFPVVPHVSGYITYTTMTVPTERNISAGDEGQTYDISATIANDFPFEYSADYGDGNDLKWYLLRFPNPQKPRYIQYEQSATDKYAVTEKYTADDCYLWAFIGNPFEGFKLVNKATGEQKLYAADLSDAKYPLMSETNATEWIAIKSTRNGFGGCFGLKASTAEEYLNNYGGNGYLSLWHDSQNQDNGSNIVAIKVPEDIPSTKAAIQSIIAPAGKKFGTGLGQYTWSNAEAVAAAQAAIENDNATLKELRECLAGLQNVTATLNQPATGKFYRFKSATATNNEVYRIMTSTVEENRMKMETNGSNAAPTVFYLDEANHLVALSNGLCIGKFKVGDTAKSWQCLLASDDDASTVVFRESGTIGKYNICVNDGNRYLNHASTNNVVDCGGSDADEDYRWTVEEVTWLPVPINTGVGFATLYSPVELMRSYNRVKAYTGTISGDYIKLTEIEGNIPANTPVVLEYVPGAEIVDGCVFLEVASNEATAGNNNCFSGQILAEDASEKSGINTLQKIDDTVGFYNYTGNTLYGFKAYIENQGANVRGFALKFGETTGIDGIDAEQTADEMLYDLNGRIALYPASGIYVTASGKKVLVK